MLVLAAALVILPAAVVSAAGDDILYRGDFGGEDADHFCSTVAISDGFVAAGYSYSGSFGSGDWTDVQGMGYTDAIIVRYDDAGSIVWKESFGGSGNDIFYSVTEVSDGFVAVGQSAQTSFRTGDWTDIRGKGGIDAIAVKYDHEGNVVWKMNIGGPGSDSYRSVAAVPGGFVAVGFSHISSLNGGDWTGFTAKGTYCATIVKYNNDGEVQWKKNFGGDGVDYFTSVVSTTDGVVAVGYAQALSFGTGDWEGEDTDEGGSYAVAVRYDDAGGIVWKSKLGGNESDYYYSVTAVEDGFAAVGYSTALGEGDWSDGDARGGTDAFITRFDSAGEVLWNSYLGGSGNDFFRGVAALEDGIIAVGYSAFSSFGSGDWEGFEGKGFLDATVVKYSHSGEVVWKTNFGGTGADYFRSVSAGQDWFVAVGYSNISVFGDGDWTDIDGKGGLDATMVKFSGDAGSEGGLDIPPYMVAVVFLIVLCAAVIVSIRKRSK